MSSFFQIMVTFDYNTRCHVSEESSLFCIVLHKTVESRRLQHFFYNRDTNFSLIFSLLSLIYTKIYVNIIVHKSICLSAAPPPPSDTLFRVLNIVYFSLSLKMLRPHFNCRSKTRNMYHLFDNDYHRTA
jgi:hypothetical protein